MLYPRSGGSNLVRLPEVQIQPCSAVASSQAGAVGVSSMAGSQQYLPCLNANIGRKEQDDWMMNLSLNQPPPHTVQAEETCTVLDSPSKTNEVFKTVPPRHAVIGARPFCSPEYSPDFHKLGSTVPYSTYRPRTNIRADTCTPLQPSAKTHVPYSERKSLLDKQEEIQEVKQLDEWKPAVGIFTAVLEELDSKAS